MSGLFFLSFDCNAALISDFAGVWYGQGTFVAADETTQGPVIMNLYVDGDVLEGTLSVYGEPPAAISGTVINGVFIFPVPNTEPGEPDCVNMNVTATATLDQSLTIMSMIAEGTFCGDGGGKPGRFTGTLNKTGNNLNATLENFAGDWFGEGTFVAEDETTGGAIALSLQAGDSLLTGTISIFDESTVSVSGTVTNGILTFTVPNSEPGDPDCANFDVTAIATLDDTLTTLSLIAVGIYCGDGGGKEGTTVGVLKKRGYIPPVNYLMLKTN